MITKTHTPDLVNSLPCVLNCETQVRGFISGVSGEFVREKEKQPGDLNGNINL